MEPTQLINKLSRRAFLSQGALGLGSLAAAEMLGPLDGGLHHKPRAKQVIYLALSGAPPQHDLWDPKPKLQELHGTLCPESMLEGRRLAFIKGVPTLLGSPHAVKRIGKGNMLMGSMMPHFERIVDQVCVVRSLHTDQFNHAPADLMLYTGSAQAGAAGMGAWANYGLGSLSRNLPGYVVMVSGGSDPTGGKGAWGSGFLPPEYQGVRLRSGGDPVLYVSNPKGMDRASRRRSLDALAKLNERTAQSSGDPEVRARMEQYELAFRMQAAVPEAVDLASEPEDVLRAYGAKPGEKSFANHCLLARRLVERGVRWVQLHDWGWDLHGTNPGDDLGTAFPKKCEDVDRPIAALILDLERRGLLDETLVVCSGEFGRTPMNEARNGSKLLGRDHHPDCFSGWLAGAGVHKGLVYGATDDLGYEIVENPVSVHDLQATILHLLGLNPETLSYAYQGLDQRLIGPAHGPRVITDLFA
ncbi:MAG: hypothetical protein ACI8QC_001848 [Planctomycetota bacterium]|jgi:hypothetical protein